jgi:hypothetical protein
MATAIVRAYCDDGFVVASDARFSDFATRKVISDHVQKIIQIGNKPLAYVMMGITKLGHRNEQALDQVLFDFNSEVSKAVKSISIRESWSLEHFANRISRPVNATLSQVCQSGDVDLDFTLPPDNRRGTTIVNLFLDGYIGGLPSRARVRFYHQDGAVAQPEVSIEDSESGMVWYYGSTIVADAFMEGNPDFQKYKVQPQRHFSGAISQHIGLALGYIETCASPDGLRLDPQCWSIGGRPMAATITPKDGFQWVPDYGP